MTEDEAEDSDRCRSHASLPLAEDAAVAVEVAGDDTDDDGDRNLNLVASDRDRGRTAGNFKLQLNSVE
jgi:hypothetical protein